MIRAITLLIAAFLLAVPVPTFAAGAERTTTLRDRRLVNLTVYNGGMALVHDWRRLNLYRGMNRIAWRDVSEGMDETSVLLEPIGSSNHVTVLEQNFDFDLLDPDALLNRYVGKMVTVVHPARFAGQRTTRERARLLSTNGGIVLQYADRIETQLRGYIVYPSAPANFRDRPTLLLDLQSSQSGPQTLDLSYLTSGMTWRADYVGALSADETHLSLRGLVTLSNTSGESYHGARLQLVAGNVNVVQPVASRYMLKTIARVTSRASGMPSEENYFEYHLYTFPRRTSILNDQTKQLTLLSARDVPVRKTLELRGSPYYYQSATPDIGDRLPVGVYVSFTNRGGDLGVPLPAGVVRLYKKDSRGLSQFIGSDRIDHTPRNETVRLHLGDSFDVTARKRQTDYRQDGNCASESSYEIVLANAKSVPQDVLVVESIPGDWQIIQESAPHAKTSSSTASWTVDVPANQRRTLTYTARVSWC